jgi:hypothetical protein
MRTFSIIAVLAFAIHASLAPCAAGAQCRAVTPEESAGIAAAPLGSSTSDYPEWVRPADDFAIGRCGVDGDWCIAVGAVICETGLFHAVELHVSTVLAGAERLLVLRWSADRGGNAFHAGDGLEVWTTGATPQRLLSVVEQWNEGEFNPDDVEPRDVCFVRRMVRVRDSGIAIGRRSSRGQCDWVLSLDRRGRRTLGADPGFWTWSALMRR